MSESNPHKRQVGTFAIALLPQGMSLWSCGLKVLGQIMFVCSKPQAFQTHGHVWTPFLLDSGVILLFMNIMECITFSLQNPDTMTFISFTPAVFLGPYTEHPASPVVKGDKARGRNAGVLFEVDDALYRPVQDCSRMYGKQVRLMKIEELSVTGYRETEIDHSPILAGSGKGWNQKKMHTFNVFNINDIGFSVITDGTPVDYEYRIIILKRSK
jgi:hypothetical protein